MSGPSQQHALSTQGKICPLLSVATLAVAQQPASLIVGAGPQAPVPEGHATVCQGPACALFIPIADEKGQIVAGGCAIGLLPTAANTITQALNAIAASLGGSKHGS